LQIVDLRGNLVQTTAASESSTQLNIEKLAVGNYLIRIGKQGTWTEAGRFVKQ
jgi:Secretion system C-terminal sorting domain